MADSGPRYARTAVNAVYCDGLAAGELWLQRCAACGRSQFYSRPLCTACGSAEIGWHHASGRGRIYSMTRLDMAPSAPFKAALPYGLGLIDLEEGPRMMAHLRNPEALAIGMALRFATALVVEGADPVPVFVAEWQDHA